MATQDLPEVRILVVDDSDLMRHNLRQLLEAQEHWKVCDEASNGPEAIAKSNAQKFDIIVLDFQMPLMDGLMAAKLIRKESPEIPILMVSLHASEYLAKEARKAGIRGVCGKADIKCVVEGVSAMLANRSYFHI